MAGIEDRLIARKAALRSYQWLSRIIGTQPIMMPEAINLKFSVSNASEIEQTLDLFSREPNGGLIVLPNPLTQKHRDLIIALAARDPLPVIYPHSLYAKSGGLMTNGTDLVDMYRRTTTYIDRILRGAKPADLPVQGPTKYELVINLKTAKALGLQIPDKLLALADEAIE